MRSGDQLERKAQFRTDKSRTVSIPDDVLLEVIENNVQRLPGNDNASHVRADPPKLGFFASVFSSLAFAGVMLVGAVVLAVFKLVPKSQDSHY